MKELYICDKEEDLKEAGVHKYNLVEWENVQKTLEIAAGGVFAVVTSTTAGLGKNWFSPHPDWSIYRLVGPEARSNPELMDKIQRVNKALDNFTVVDMATQEEAKKTPASQKEDKRYLFLVEEEIGFALLGTVFTNSGKSLRTEGRNPYVITGNELSDIVKSNKPIGRIEIPARKLSEWDAPDILDDFYVVVFSTREHPLPTCEGDLNLFTFGPDDLEDLTPLYSFLQMTPE